MAELEIHHEHEGGKDPMGQKVGVLASVLAVFLAIVSISSHRAHTAAILSRTSANDQWGYYQASRIKAHNLEVGRDLLAALGKGDGKKLQEYTSGIDKYEERSKENKET